MRKENVSPILFHELLWRIVQDFGEEILSDNRLKGIISDLSVGSDVYKFQSIISRSISYHIGERILRCRDLDDADLSLRINTLKQSFQEENFFQHGVSDYIVDSYLFALGWIDHLDGYDTKCEMNGGECRTGELTFVERSGEDYCGNVSKDGQRSGFGISKREDGSYFAGEWKLDIRAGLGIEVTGTRTKYAGEWKMNRKNGIGITMLEDGIRYSGEWKNGKMHGIGILYYPNGERMCASFVNGEIYNDPGVYILKDGSSVVGIMTSQGPHGTCLHFMRNGTCETEEWINGTKN